ncbi:MAG: DUF2848 domain-containing protein [Pseudomonadota bacterium]
MPITLTFQCHTVDCIESTQISLQSLVIAGWTGRDAAAVAHHIDELAALGVPKPKTTPVFYSAATSRITQASTVEMLGQASSGEAEVALIQSGGALWVGLGSDHTDREAEVHGISLSKQMCDKPISSILWRYTDVAPHWDSLVLRSTIIEAGEKVLYQDGPVSTLLAPSDLIARYTSEQTLADGTVLFCGTHPAIGGVRASKRFEMALIDPVLNRSIVHGYDVMALPIEG